MTQTSQAKKAEEKNKGSNPSSHHDSSGSSHKEDHHSPHQDTRHYSSHLHTNPAVELFKTFAIANPT